MTNEASSKKVALAKPVPTITLKLSESSTTVEMNDAMLSLPAIRLQRAFHEAHKAVHRRRLEKHQQQAKTQPK